MHALRTRFKKDIVCEFLPGRKGVRRVVIFCGGMPSVPCTKSFLELWAKKGYWSFAIRYRGSWESGGTFLKHSPEKDVLDVLDELPKGFMSIWDGKRYKVDPTHVYLIGGSFGGPAAILASRDRRVTKAVCVAPVVDWSALGPDEPLDWLYGFVRDAFGEGYRFSKREWQKLGRGSFYNPVAHTDTIDGRKLFLIHAKDDRSVRYVSVKRFAKEVGCGLYTLPRGGHLSSSVITRPYLYRRIKKFLRDS